VADANREAGLVGEFLQLGLPESDAVAVAAAAVGGDLQRAGGGVAFAPQLLPPRVDRRDRKLGGLGGDSDVDEPLVRSDVIDAVGDRLAGRVLI
jgi:hypothetical protein